MMTMTTKSRNCSALSVIMDLQDHVTIDLCTVDILSNQGL
jgi:hypothetical protein